MIHVRQSRPDAGLVFQVKVFHDFLVVAVSLGSGRSESGLNCSADGPDRSERGQSNLEKLIICKVSSRRFTFQNDLC